MKAFSKILLDNPNLEKDQQQEFLGIIVKESDRISRLINQVLDLRKIEATKNNGLIEPIPINTIITEACRSFLQVMEDKNIHFVYPKAPTNILIKRKAQSWLLG